MQNAKRRINMGFHVTEKELILRRMSEIGTSFRSFLMVLNGYIINIDLANTQTRLGEMWLRQDKIIHILSKELEAV